MGARMERAAAALFSDRVEQVGGKPDVWVHRLARLVVQGVVPARARSSKHGDVYENDPTKGGSSRPTRMAVSVEKGYARVAILGARVDCKTSREMVYICR